MRDVMCVGLVAAVFGTCLAWGQPTVEETSVRGTRIFESAGPRAKTINQKSDKREAKILHSLGFEEGWHRRDLNSLKETLGEDAINYDLPWYYQSVKASKKIGDFQYDTESILTVQRTDAPAKYYVGLYLAYASHAGEDSGTPAHGIRTAIVWGYYSSPGVFYVHNPGDSKTVAFFSSLQELRELLAPFLDTNRKVDLTRILADSRTVRPLRTVEQRFEAYVGDYQKIAGHLRDLGFAVENNPLEEGLYAKEIFGKKGSSEVLEVRAGISEAPISDMENESYYWGRGSVNLGEQTLFKFNTLKQFNRQMSVLEDKVFELQNRYPAL